MVSCEVLGCNFWSPLCASSWSLFIRNEQTKLPNFRLVFGIRSPIFPLRGERHFGALSCLYAIRSRLIMVTSLEEYIWALQPWPFFQFLMKKTIRFTIISRYKSSVGIRKDPIDDQHCWSHSSGLVYFIPTLIHAYQSLRIGERHFGTLSCFYAIRSTPIMVALREQCIRALQHWLFFRLLMKRTTTCIHHIFLTNTSMEIS